jgi:hypothetical protein
MTRSRTAVWGFMLAAILLLAVAFLPILRGGNLNATFLPLAVVFFILGIAAAKKSRNTSSSPPAA